jgi:TPR repeat protein
MYDNGEGVLQDYVEAVKWYRLTADQGDANAQANLL